MNPFESSPNEAKKLGKQLIELSLQALNQKLANASESEEIVIFGGAATCLVWKQRIYTRH